MAGVTIERGEEAFGEAPARFHRTCRDEMRKRIKQVEDITSEKGRHAHVHVVGAAGHHVPPARWWHRQ